LGAFRNKVALTFETAWHFHEPSVHQILRPVRKHLHH
jgi:hypothetical protein